MSAENVLDLLSNDSLNVPNEETIYHALITWYKHDVMERKKHLYELLSFVRLPLMEPQVSYDLITNMKKKLLRIYNKCISSVCSSCSDRVFVVVVVDLPLLRVAVEGSDNPITLEQPCQASLPRD